MFTIKVVKAKFSPNDIKSNLNMYSKKIHLMF